MEIKKISSLQRKKLQPERVKLNPHPSHLLFAQLIMQDELNYLLCLYTLCHNNKISIKKLQILCRIYVYKSKKFHPYKQNSYSPKRVKL